MKFEKNMQSLVKAETSDNVCPVTDEEVPDQDILGRDHSIGKEYMKKNLQKSRCFQCSRRVPLHVQPCKCERLFCSAHSFSKDHGCPFDYKAKQKAVLESMHQPVVAKKILPL